MTDDAKTGLRALGFAFTQVGLVAAMVYAIVGVRGWVGPTWGVTFLCLFFVRLDKWAARRELARLGTGTEDEDPDEIDIQGMQDKVAKATMQMAELSAPIVESANGQRATLVANGWSETAAEQMAVSYYAAMISSFHREIGHG